MLSGSPETVKKEPESYPRPGEPSDPPGPEEVSSPSPDGQHSPPSHPAPPLEKTTLNGAVQPPNTSLEPHHL